MLLHALSVHKCMNNEKQKACSSLFLKAIWWSKVSWDFVFSLHCYDTLSAMVILCFWICSTLMQCKCQSITVPWYCYSFFIRRTVNLKCCYVVTLLGYFNNFHFHGSFHHSVKTLVQTGLNISQLCVNCGMSHLEKI